MGVCSASPAFESRSGDVDGPLRQTSLASALESVRGERPAPGSARVLVPYGSDEETRQSCAELVDVLFEPRVPLV